MPGRSTLCETMPGQYQAKIRRAPRSNTAPKKQGSQGLVSPTPFALISLVTCTIFQSDTHIERVVLISPVQPNQTRRMLRLLFLFVEAVLVSMPSTRGDPVSLCKAPCSGFSAQALSFMDAREMCKRLQDDVAFKEWVAVGVKNFSNKEHPFMPQQGDQGHIVALSVKQKATILNASEFKNYMKRFDRQKFARTHPSCKVKTIVDGSVVMEKVYLFRYDPTSPFISLTFKLATEVNHIFTYMDKSTQYFQAQGSVVHDHLPEEQSKECATSSASQESWCTWRISEHR